MSHLPKKLYFSSWYNKEKYDIRNTGGGGTIFSITGDNIMAPREFTNRLCDCYNAMDGLTNEQVTELRETVKELREIVELGRSCFHGYSEYEKDQLIDRMTAALTRSKHLK